MSYLYITDEDAARSTSSFKSKVRLPPGKTVHHSRLFTFLPETAVGEWLLGGVLHPSFDQKNDLAYCECIRTWVGPDMAFVITVDIVAGTREEAWQRLFYKSPIQAYLQQRRDSNGDMIRIGSLALGARPSVREMKLLVLLRSQFDARRMLWDGCNNMLPLMQQMPAFVLCREDLIRLSELSGFRGGQFLFYRNSKRDKNVRTPIYSLRAEHRVLLKDFLVGGLAGNRDVESVIFKVGLMPTQRVIQIRNKETCYFTSPTDFLCEDEVPHRIFMQCAHLGISANIGALFYKLNIIGALGFRSRGVDRHPMQSTCISLYKGLAEALKVKLADVLSRYAAASKRRVAELAADAEKGAKQFKFKCKNKTIE